MPTMANITVKKADGTTDIVYAALAPAGADGTKAVWRQDAGQPAAMPVGHRAILEVRAVSNGPGTARRVEGVFKRPYSFDNTVTGVREVRDTVVGNFSVTLPKNMPAAELNEGSFQFANLMASALLKAAYADGYAPS